MERQRLLMLKGLPASGKTTHAKELEEQGWFRANKDDIRTEYFPEWTFKDEKDVIVIQSMMIVNALDVGLSVVVDDTNFHPKHEERLTLIARNRDVELETLFIDTHPEECIRRNSKRQKSVPIGAITSMYDKYIAPLREEKVEYDDSLKEAIIVDMDGTLANIGDRSPYDSSRADIDTVNDSVASVLSMAYGHGYEVIILTGRHGEDLPVTEKWLEENNINYDQILIRAEGDTRKDYIVKRELYDNNIRGKYNVKFVMDDRPQVCREWRRIGLPVLQVGDPHNEF